MQIEPYDPRYLDAVIRLSLRAWTPVFDSIQKAMNADVYQAFYPNHWRVSQQKAVEDVCAAEDTNVWVAMDAGSTVGFVAVKLHSENCMGEIYRKFWGQSLALLGRLYQTATRKIENNI